MKIAIAGFGMEGRANLKYFRAKYPSAEFVIFDENTISDNAPKAKIITGENVFSQIRGFDLVLRTAGLSPHKIPSENKKIWSATNEFFANCPAKIIGVTGSKGKGTTCSFINEILKAANKTAHLVGNFGVASLDVLMSIKPDDLVIYELSSFQLWDLKKSPNIAVLTLIEPDHLDVHENFAEYVEAKSRIFEFQKSEDLAVFNEDDILVREIAKSSLQKNPRQNKSFMNAKFAHIREGKFYYNNTEIGDISIIKLPGEHNLRNAAAAINATWDLIDENAEIVSKGLSNFHGLPHRLKFVAEINSVKYYDDSIATTQGSAIAALRSFEKPKILILGGHDKGANYFEIGEIVEKLNCENEKKNLAPNVRAIIIFGENRSKIKQQISEKSSVNIVEINTDNLQNERIKIKTNTPEFRGKLNEISMTAMREIVMAAKQISQSGDLIILSPAAASFDLFDNYKVRGESFARAVKNLQ